MVDALFEVRRQFEINALKNTVNKVNNDKNLTYFKLNKLWLKRCGIGDKMIFVFEDYAFAYGIIDKVYILKAPVKDILNGRESGLKGQVCINYKHIKLAKKQLRVFRFWHRAYVDKQPEYLEKVNNWLAEQNNFM